MRAAWARLIRYGFWLLYNPFAFSYDLVSWIVSMGEWREWQRAALDHLPEDGTILDLAHGTGNLQLDLLARGRLAVGYDLSRSMGRITGRKLRREKRPVRLARGMAQQMPFADRMFTGIVSTFPSDFITAEATIQECSRVLRAGGLLVIVPSATFTGGGLMRRALEFAYRVTGQQTGGDLSEALVKHMETFARQRFSPYGFEVMVTSKPLNRSIVFVIVARKVAEVKS
ncbi:MAG: methyltransferase domain-containing protein [Anaerolineae bacterium]|nr:methyltransferase domain-containing protein [Anaerolineae bacterium]